MKTQGYRGVRSLLGLVGLLLLAGCSGAEIEEKTGAVVVHELKSEAPRVVPDSNEAQGAVLSEQDFGIVFLQQLAADSNVVFSPHSISTAFAMLSDAAAGQTLSEVEQALRFGPVDDAFHRSQDALSLALAGRNRDAIDTEAQKVAAQILTESNDVWIRDDMPPEPSYLDTLAKFYGVGVHQADFGNQPEASRQAINAKVSRDTHDLIPELIPEKKINESTLAVLTSALYFKAPWPDKLPDAVPGAFNLFGGSTKQVPMLKTEQHLAYYEGDSFVSVAVPYYGGDLELMLIVPDAGAYERVRANLSGQLLGEIVSGRTEPKVNLTFPKLDLKSSVPAKDVLQALGIAAAFDPDAAELPKFPTPPGTRSYVDDVLHQATIVVDEKGTEASAATAIIIGVGSSAPPIEEVKTVVVDRPFLFAVRDNPTGALLFAGQAVSP